MATVVTCIVLLLGFWLRRIHQNQRLWEGFSRLIEVHQSFAVLCLFCTV